MQTRAARQQPHQHRGRQTTNNGAQGNLNGAGIEDNNLQKRTGRSTIREADNIRRTQGITRNHLENRTRETKRRTHQKRRHNTRRTLLSESHRNLLALTQQRRDQLLRGDLIITLQHAPKRQRRNQHHQRHIQNQHTPRHLSTQRTAHSQHRAATQIAAATTRRTISGAGGSRRRNSGRIRHQRASTLRRVIKNKNTGAPARVATIPT